MDNISARLLKTRDNLADVCEELGVELPDEDTLMTLQCVNCGLWQLRRLIKIEDDVPVCTFCADMSLLRF